MPPRAIHGRKNNQRDRQNTLDGAERTSSDRQRSPTGDTSRSGSPETDNWRQRSPEIDTLRPDVSHNGFVQQVIPDETSVREDTDESAERPRKQGLSKTAVGRRLSGFITETLINDDLNDRALALDRLVCRAHKMLTLSGMIIYVLESAMGTVLLVTEWSARENQIVRVFLLLRICSYLYLMWSSYDKTLDFEAAHPGLHLTWTMVYSICVVTLLSSTRKSFGTSQKSFMFASVIIDNLLLLVTFVVLRSCRCVVDNAIEEGHIKDIHPASKRYLDFIPPASKDGDERTARHLLWQTVHVFEEVREHMNYVQQKEPGSQD